MEFALVLPILLVLVYGLLEMGRLLFIYSSVISASRNAARYGSADGTGSNGKLYYQDCAGINAAANNLAFINSFSNISITYDAGLAYGTITPQPIGSGVALTTQCSAVSSWPIFQSGYRIIVQVTAQYSPIIAISNLIPSFKPLTITSQSSRTLLLSVPINATAGTSWSLTETHEVAVASYTATITPTSTKTLVPSSTPTNTATPAGTFTKTLTPSTTPSPTNTNTSTPTSTNTPAYTLTPAIACSGKVTHGALTYPGNTMTMAITNSTGISLAVQGITVYWNNATGGSGNSALVLQSVTLGGVSLWTGNNNAPTFSVPFGYAILPNGASSIVFTFPQAYANRNGTERIIINFLTNGCQNYPVDSSN